MLLPCRMSKLASGCSGSKLGPPARPSFLVECFRFACACANRTQRSCAKLSRLQPRGSRPLAFCHNCRANQSYLEDARASVPSILNFSNICIQKRRFCPGRKRVELVHPLSPLPCCDRAKICAKTTTLPVSYLRCSEIRTY